jgi:hypothetical protein
MSGININEVNKKTGLVGIGPQAPLSPVASFNVDAIQNLIDTKGYFLLHFRHAFNPDRQTVAMGVNVNNEWANYHGVIYYETRVVKGLMVNISYEHRLETDTLYGMASSVLQIGGIYADGLNERVYVRPRDVFVPCAEITEQTSELLEFNNSGPLRCKHKVKDVSYLASNVDVFIKDYDFCIDKETGVIMWLETGRKPLPKTVLSIVYFFTPAWIVTRVPHTLRLIPSNNQGAGYLPRQLTYAPQQVIVTQNHLQDMNTQLDFSGLPNYSGNFDTSNVSGGSL